MLKVLTAGLLLTALYNFLVFNSQPGIGFSLFIVFINWTLFLFNKNSRNPLLGYGFGIASAVFALLFSFRSNGIVQLVDLFAAVTFLLLNIYFSKSNLKFDFTYLSFLSAPFKAGIKFVEGFIESFIPKTWAEHSSNKHVTSSLLRGLFIGVPVLVVLFFILSRADPVFENITFSFLEDVWIRIIFSLIVFVSALSLGIMKIFEAEEKKEVTQVSDGKEYELLVILGGLALLFSGFIFIQFKYLFSGNIGERELVNLGIKSLTYSEYVRKGFFELLLASVISSGVVFYALRYIHKLRDRGKLLVQIFTSVVTLEVGMLLWSAAMRVNLYQMEHGLTRARVFGMFFLVWLAALLIILLIRIIKDLNSKTYLSLNIISTLLILGFVNFINVDGLIANNEHKPTVNNEIDYYYLAYLSPDAHESWIPAIKDAENVAFNLREREDLNAEDYRVLYWHLGAAEAVNSQVTYLKDKYGSEEKAIARHVELRKTNDAPLSEYIYQSRKLQSFNLGEYLAHEYVQENPEIFDKLPQLLKDLQTIQSRINPEIMRNTVLDRSTNPPLSN